MSEPAWQNRLFCVKCDALIDTYILCWKCDIKQPDCCPRCGHQVDNHKQGVYRVARCHYDKRPERWWRTLRDPFWEFKKSVDNLQ